MLTNEPDWRALPSTVPQPLRTLLQRRLVKDCRHRVADVSTFTFVLDNVASLAAPAGTAPTGPSYPATAGRRRIAAAVGAGALMVGVLGGALEWVATRPAPLRVTRFALSPTGAARLSIDPVQRDLTVLPDGTHVVYVGLSTQGSSLFARALIASNRRCLWEAAWRVHRSVARWPVGRLCRHCGWRPCAQEGGGHRRTSPDALFSTVSATAPRGVMMAASSSPPSIRRPDSNGCWPVVARRWC